MENWIESLTKNFITKLSERLNEEQGVPELPFGALESGGSSVFGLTQSEKDEEMVMAKATKKYNRDRENEIRKANSEQKQKEHEAHQREVAKQRRQLQIKKASEAPDFPGTLTETKNWLQSLNKTYTNILKNQFVKEEAALDGPSAQLHPDIVKELIRQGYHHPVHNPIKRSSSTSGRGYFIKETPANDPYSFPNARIVDPETKRVTLHPSYEGWTILSGPYGGD